jgi:gliding motility-associated-like protein
MKKIYFNYVNHISLFLISLSSIIAQPCVKIESILVAACTSPGSLEGSNEMMRFKVGDTALNTVNMNIVWGSGQYAYFGVIQNASTANIVAQLNSTIQSCGYLKEPVNGVLPPNSQVLIITGTNTSTTANSFAQLSDTLWILFQNSAQSGGHFLNFVETGILAQTTTISFLNIPNCSSTATYFRNQLLMINGMVGNEPGATVNFDENMNPTYINNGCIASIGGVSAEWNAPGNICALEEPINLDNLITGTPGGFWTGDGVTGNIFNPAGLSGFANVTYNVVNEACNDTLTNTQVIIISPETDASFTLPENICNYDSPINLINTITGSTGGVFSGSSISFGTFNPTSLSGPYQITYTVGEGLCQSVLTQTINVIVLPDPQLSSNSGDYCPDEELETIEVLNAGTFTALWYDDEALTNEINEGATYTPNTTENINIYVTLNQAGCVSETAVYNLVIHPIETIIEADVDTALAPFDLVAFNESTNAETCQWYLDGVAIDTISGLVFAVTLEEPGEYVLKLVCENEQGCKDSTEKTIVVFTDKVELVIPNVFTPNGDNVNDIFTFQVSGIKTMAGKIFNRWGQLVYEWDGLQAFWDGTVNDKDAPAGVYYYIVETVDIFDEAKDNKGTVTLIR